MIASLLKLTLLVLLLATTTGCAVFDAIADAGIANDRFMRMRYATTSTCTTTGDAYLGYTTTCTSY